MALLRRFWNRLRRPSARFGVGVLAGGGIVAGILIAATFSWAIEATNSAEFCSTCHGMQWVHAEWQESHHYANNKGIRAECADCHVPKDFWPKKRAKLLAANDVLQHILRTIHTEEKFMERRQLLAERVWSQMRASDSRPCRSCHTWEAMTLESQPTRARRQHVDGLEAGETCIDCHKGVSHQYPKVEVEEEEVDFTF